MYNVSGLGIVTKPGKTDVVLTIIAEERAIKRSPPYKIDFKLEIRSCVLGEEQLRRGENFICQKCALGWYLLETPEEGVVTPCIPCPGLKAKCEGGYKIGPTPGFWRRNTTSAEFLKCPPTGACLGLYLNYSTAQPYSYTGFCGEGYYGALCSSCVPTYYRSGEYGCELCADPSLNGLRMAGVLALVITFVVLLVKSTIAGQRKA